ncbi:hypothetical protein ALPO108162_09640 [Alicyclobacillus pomorum]
MYRPQMGPWLDEGVLSASNITICAIDVSIPGLGECQEEASGAVDDLLH